MSAATTPASASRGIVTDTPTRRAVLALSALALAGGCSRMAYDVGFTVTPDAMPRLLEVVEAFTRAYGYRQIAGPNGVGAEYAGWRSRFWMVHSEADRYFAAFYHRTDLWLMFGPHADLYAFLDDFKSRIVQVEGVRILEGY